MSPSPAWRYVRVRASFTKVANSPASAAAVSLSPSPPPPGPRLCCGRHDLLLLGPAPLARGGGSGSDGWRFAWLLDPANGARLRGGFVPSAASQADHGDDERDEARFYYFTPVELVPNAGVGGRRPLALVGGATADAVGQTLADLRPGEFCRLGESTLRVAVDTIAGRVAADPSRHCLLPVLPVASLVATVERLHCHGVYPIVLQLDRGASSAETSAAAASASAVRLLNSELAPVLSGVVDCGDVDDISQLCSQVMEAVSRCQFGPVWIKRLGNNASDDLAHY